MDFLDPKKKRAHKIRLFIGYGLMGIVLAFSTTLIVLLTSGYDVDPSTGSVFKNGLFIVDSSPVKASVYVNGSLSGQTLRRLVLREGEYLIEVRQDGYRTWQRKMFLSGSVIERLDYPFLFPSSLNTTEVATYKNESNLIAQSPDRRWLVVEDPGNFGAFDLYDLSSEGAQKTTINLPSDTLTPSTGTHKFKLVEWSTDNQNVLIQHTWRSGTEYIVANMSSPLDSINVSKLFPRYASYEVSLWDKNARQFYFYNPTTLSLLQARASDESASVVLAGVSDFKTYKDDTVVYVNKEQEVRLYRDGEDIFVRDIPKHDTYMLDFAQYDDSEYFVFGSAADSKVYIYEDPFQQVVDEKKEQPNALRLLSVETPEFVSFSNNARFIAVQGGSEFAVYDAETSRQYKYDIGLTTALNERAYWMDGHRLTMVSGRKTYVFDFNGINLHELAESDVLTRTFFDRDYESMFNIFTTKNKKSVNRTSLVVEQN